jgi:hypothetical protein
MRNAELNPKSEIPNPKSFHGDAIVRDFHPASPVSSETLYFVKEQTKLLTYRPPMSTGQIGTAIV